MKKHLTNHAVIGIILIFAFSCSSSDKSELSEQVDDSMENSQGYDDVQTFNNQYSDDFADQYSEDSGEGLDQYTEDLSAQEDSSYMLGDGSIQLASGNTFFITQDTGVYSTSDLSSETKYYLSAGDTVRADIVGDYAQIGQSSFILASVLSQEIVLRSASANPWR